MRHKLLLASVFFLCGALPGSIPSYAQETDPWEAYDNAMLGCINQISPGYMEKFTALVTTDPEDIAAEDIPSPLGKTLSEQSERMKQLMSCMETKGYQPRDMDNFAMYGNMIDSYLEKMDQKEDTAQTAEEQRYDPPSGQNTPPVSGEAESQAQPPLYVTPPADGQGGNHLFVPQD